MIMKQEEEQYANRLIEQYDNIFRPISFTIQYAIQDVENTIEALTTAVNLEYGSTKIDNYLNFTIMISLNTKENREWIKWLVTL